MENTIIKRYTPHIRVKDSVPKVMGDVIIALLPAILASGAVYGLYPLLVILTSVVSAVVTEFLFSAIFFLKKKHNSSIFYELCSPKMCRFLQSQFVKANLTLLSPSQTQSTSLKCG